MGKPWERRILPFREAQDCIDMLPFTVGQQMWREAQEELAALAEAEG